MIFRFEDQREPETLDLECDRIEHHQDKLDLLKMLVNALKPSLNRLNHRSGYSSFIVCSDNNNKFKFHASMHDIQQHNNLVMRMNGELKFHLNGDTKGVMQLLGRSGFDRHYCICCKIGSGSKMNEHHREACVDVQYLNRHEFWSMQDLTQNAISQSQIDLNDNQFF